MNVIAPVVLALQLNPTTSVTAVHPNTYRSGPSIPEIIAIQPVKLPSPVTIKGIAEVPHKLPAPVIAGEIYKMPVRLTPVHKELPAATPAMPKMLPGRVEDQFKRFFDELFDGKKSEKTPEPVTLPESDLENEIGVVYEP